MLSENEQEAIEYAKSLIDLFDKGVPLNYLEEENNIIKILLNLITKLEKEIKELKKYDYRNIKIEEENKIKSPSFTKEQLDLMNLGIALYIGILKILEDEDETDI